MYQIKTSPTITSGAEKAKARRLIKAEKFEKENSDKKERSDRQDSLTKEIITANREIAESIKTSADTTNNVLVSLKDQIEQITLEIPKSEDGDKISGAISQNTQKVEEAINTLIEAVSNIKIETQTLDLKPHTQEITKAIGSNIASLESSISELTNSVKEIEFEHPPIVMLSYKVTRISDKSSPFFGYIDELHPIAPEVTS